jgi:hypothetical protein
MTGLFETKLGITFANKKTVLELNGCRSTHPPNHLDSSRTLDNPKFILLDEADLLPKGEQVDVRQVSERYISKSDPFIVMILTPYTPDGCLIVERSNHRHLKAYAIRLYLFPLPYLRRTISHLINLILKYAN